MRNPNGYGSITKLSGNRRKPWMVRAAAEMIYNKDTKKTTCKRNTIGCYATRKEALQALAEYNSDPYTLESANLTFEDVYKLYFDAKFVNGKKKFSQNTINSSNFGFKHCSVLHKRKFLDIKSADLQKVIDDCTLKHASLEQILNVFRCVYSYACANDITDKNYAQYVKINIDDDDESGVPFTQDELDILWKHKNDDYIDTVLIMIYTGYRISAWKTMKIQLDERYLLGGVKTTSAKERIVPIHSSIYDMISSYNGSSWLDTSVTNYRRCFYSALDKLGILISSKGTKHTPHDCRHTSSNVL